MSGGSQNPRAVGDPGTPAGGGGVVPLRVMMAVAAGGGNLPPIAAVARALVARGHTVHVLAGPYRAPSGSPGDEPWGTGMRERFERAGCTVEFLPARVWAEGATALPTADGAPTATPGLGWIGRTAFIFETAETWAEQTARLIAAFRPDVCAVDCSLGGAAAAAEAAGVPVAGLFTPGHLFVATPDRPVPSLGIRRADWRPGSAEDRAARRELRAMTDHWWLPQVNAARSRLGLAPWRHYDEFLLHGVNPMLVLHSPAVAEPSALLPDNHVYVGAAVPEVDAAAPDGEATAVGEDGRPLVVVSGTTTSMAPTMVPYFAAAIEALAELPVRGLVTAGGELDPALLPSAPNVEVRGYLPHAGVFPRAAAVVSHCGLGTVLAALRAGVPLVCVPAFLDQADNAARVADLGAGVWVQGERTPTAIRDAVRAVLEEPRYRLAAERLAAAMVHEDGGLEGARQIEAIASQDPPARRA